MQKKEFEQIYGSPALLDKTAWRQNQERLRFSSKDEGRMQETHESHRLVRKVGQLYWKGRGYNDDMRVICRADYTDAGTELRFVITNRAKGNPRWLYENRYCGRGQCENWIKELKAINCDRLSCQEFKANQFRLLEHTMAYILLKTLRDRLSKFHATISIDQLRLKFVRIWVLVKESARRIHLQWSECYPCKLEFIRLSTEIVS
ncbi:MAG: transposase [Cyanobacteria bacterium SZAS-4]|nr:transposase [Cyanobacteria bacterium SZAS-4]